MLDIEKIKSAALTANQAWMDEAYEIEPSAVLELIDRLEAAVGNWICKYMASETVEQYVNGDIDSAKAIYMAMLAARSE